VFGAEYRRFRLGLWARNAAVFFLQFLMQLVILIFWVVHPVIRTGGKFIVIGRPNGGLQTGQIDLSHGVVAVT
jgi:hypothetical protein